MTEEFTLDAMANDWYPKARQVSSFIMDTEPQPLISVVIPSYNYGRYLEGTIRSVLNQTWRNLQLIVVDNASTDDSLAIARRFLSDPRVEVLEIHENRGPVPAWNLGFQQVRGEWFAMLPADDFFELDKFEKQMAYVQAHPEVNMLATYVRQVDDAGKPAEKSWIEPVVNQQLDFHQPEVWEWTHHFCIPTAIYRTDLCRRVGPLSVGLHSVVDIEFHVRLMRHGGEARVLPEKLTNYRWHTTNQSGKKNQQTAHQWIYFHITQFLPWVEERGLLTEERFSQSLHKLFIQPYFRECSIGEVAAFLECYRAWREFSQLWPDYASFSQYAESYGSSKSTSNALMLTLAEGVLKSSAIMLNVALGPEYAHWLEYLKDDKAAAGEIRNRFMMTHPYRPRGFKRGCRTLMNLSDIVVIYRPSMQLGRSLKKCIQKVRSLFGSRKAEDRTLTRDGP